MPKRYNYDLSNYIFQVGRVGRLMGLNVIPVVAGDSMSINLSGIFRTTPLRRELVLDSRLDMCAFFVPHRHIYSNWLDFVRLNHGGVLNGSAGAQVLATQSLSAAPSGGSAYNTLKCIPFTADAQVVPKWLLEGYYYIWNRYYRPPKQGVPQRNYSTYAIKGTQSDASNAEDVYGFPCARLPRPITQFRQKQSPVDPNKTDGNASVAIGASGNWANFARQSAVWGQELSRGWFVEYYDDIMRQVYGTKPGTDQDERPTFLMQKTQWTSGYDQAGTDAITLGTVQGRMQTPINFQMPKRFFGEHGAIWIMFCVRYPSIFVHESHFLAKHGASTYAEIMGDPFLMSKEPPRVASQGDYFRGGTAELGVEPYGQWYRFHPNVISRLFGDEFSVEGNEDDTPIARSYPRGYPFITKAPSNAPTSALCGWADYDDMFATSSLEHWNLTAHCNVNADRIIPPPMAMHGTNIE